MKMSIHINKLLIIMFSFQCCSASRFIDLTKSLDHICRNMVMMTIHSNKEETDMKTSRLLSECEESICSLKQTFPSQNVPEILEVITNCTTQLDEKLASCSEDSFSIVPTWEVMENFLFDSVLSNVVPIVLSLILYLLKISGSPRRLFVLMLVVLVGMFTTRFQCTEDYLKIRRLHEDNVDTLNNLSLNYHNRSVLIEAVNDDNQFPGTWLLGKCYQLLVMFLDTLYVKI